MITTEDIRKAIRAVLAERKQEWLSERCGISQPHLCDIANGKRNAGGISALKFLALLPYIAPYLPSDPTIHGAAVNTGTISNSSNVLNVSRSADHTLDTVRKVVDSDLPDADKVRFIRTLLK